MSLQKPLNQFALDYYVVAVKSGATAQKKLKIKSQHAEPYETHPCMATRVDRAGVSGFMNQNVTLSFGLSLLTLVVMTLILYEPETPRSQTGDKQAAAKESRSPTEKGREETKAASSPTPNPARALHPGENSAPPAMKETIENVPETLDEPRVVAEAPSTAPKKAEVAPTNAPRTLMTRVAEGETLAAFAKRVYGPDADPLAVWKSNRDILNQPEDPLVPGTMLRTP